MLKLGSMISGLSNHSPPDIVILKLGTNDLTQLSALATGSTINDLANLLYESYHVQKICVCQTLYRENAPLFNKQVNILTKYLKVVLEPFPYVLYWKHMAFWNCKSGFYHRDGIHLNILGQYKLYRSLRGAILGCWRALSAASRSALYLRSSVILHVCCQFIFV